MSKANKTGAGRYDYDAMPRRQLAALLRQARRNRQGYACEFGHEGCGCTNVRSMSGIAPCGERVMERYQEFVAEEDQP